MSTDTAKMTACSIASTRLNYCNAMLAGVSEKNLCKLQLVQNTLTRARCYWNSLRRDRIDQGFSEPHWLQIREHITFKIVTLVLKSNCTSTVVPRRSYQRVQISASKLLPTEAVFSTATVRTIRPSELEADYFINTFYFICLFSKQLYNKNQTVDET